MLLVVVVYLELGCWFKCVKGIECWVRFEMVVEVVFGEWILEGRVCYVSFCGVWIDKFVSLIGCEYLVLLLVLGVLFKVVKLWMLVKIFNFDCVIDFLMGLKKIDLVYYYESVVECILFYLKYWLVFLVWVFKGIMGQLFFQKYLDVDILGIMNFDLVFWLGYEVLMIIDSVDGLVNVV